jgi:hypothetical protein
MAAQAMHGGFVRQARARGRLVEGRHQGLLGEKIAVAPAASNRLHFIGYLENVKEFVPFEFLE